LAAKEELKIAVS